MSRRLFIGFPFVDNSAEVLQFCRRVQQDNPRWRIVDPQFWHVTLAFPGNVSPRVFDQNLAQLAEFSESLAPFDLRSLAYRWMPEKSPSMLWLEMQASAAFDLAFNGLHEKLQLHSRHTSRPHITLMRGRSKDLSGAGRLPEIAGDFPLHAVCLNAYESFLQTGGSRYELRASYSLQGMLG